MAIRRQDFIEAFRQLSKAQRILIVAHQKPDGDALGSSLALWHWLTSQGKEPAIFCKHQAVESLRFLPKVEEFVTDPTIFEQSWDLLVICDSSDLDYAGVTEHIQKIITVPPMFNIDHHTSNQNFGDLNLVDGQASSTAEVIYRFFQANNIEITDQIAQCLLTAVFTDTAGFSNGATNQMSLEMAARFVEQGASLPQVNQATTRNKSMDVMRLWGKVMSRLEQTDWGVAYTYVLRQDISEYGLDEDEIQGLANYLSHLRDAKAVFVFQERSKGRIKVSMRTCREDVDLAQLAQAMGGGGHQKAAGFTIAGRLQEVSGKVQVVR